MSWKKSPHVLAPGRVDSYNVAGDVVACSEYLIAVEAELRREPNGLARAIPEKFLRSESWASTPSFTVYTIVYTTAAGKP